LLWVPRLSRANYQRYVEFTPGSVDRLHALHARGKGVLFVTLHYGDWEMMGVGGAYYDLVMTTVTEQMRNLALRKIVDNLRAHSGNRMIAQKFATAKLFKALKRGEYVAMVIDLNGIPGYGGVWVDFFGLPVFNNATAAILALRTGAAIVGAVSYPQPGGRCLIDCSPELTFTPTGNEDADIRALSQQYSDYCQSVIREHPEFWLWTYRRWKYRPQAEVGRYPFYSQHIPVDRRVSKTINATQSPNVPQQSKP
jgi:lauroyl/myristoyl acyltransferase